MCHERGARTAEEEIIAGISAALSPRIGQVYLYDARGSELYERIVATPEYYLPDTETQLIRAHAEDIACTGDLRHDQRQGQQSQHDPDHPPHHRQQQHPIEVLIELGAGSSHPRALIVLEKLEQCTYVPIDVSGSAVDLNLAACAPLAAQRGSALQLKPLVGTYEQRLPEAALVPGRKLFLFLGSSLGNFSDDECVALLRLVAGYMHADDRFIIGVDTPHSKHKPPSVIRAAYNDAQGATARFTLNALRHVNAVAGLDFDWEHGWAHVAEYDCELRAVMTYVEALHAQDIHTGARIRYVRKSQSCMIRGTYT